MRLIAMVLAGIVLLADGGVRAQDAGPGWLGAGYRDLTKAEADALGWDQPRGAKVIKLIPRGPAESAGLLRDDVLVSLDGMEIENVAGFDAALENKPVGAEIKLSIRRAGREKRLGVPLGTRPATLAEQSPLLMLDTGGHMALIRSIAFTPDGKQLVSASNDKTIRVWDLATGKTVRTIRGEIGPGHPGKIYAMALSPDGKWLAAGGWGAAGYGGKNAEVGDIRLFDFASGRLVTRLKGHKDVVHALAFSPNGTKLISGSSDKTAIVWDVAARKPLHPPLRGHTAEIYAVGFTQGGAQVVTGSLDHDLRLWRVSDGRKIARMQGHGDKVRSLAIAPDGTIASGDFSGEIRLWNGSTGMFRKTLARQASEVGSLSFSPDGKSVLSGVGTTGADTNCHAYDVGSGRELVTYRVHDNIVLGTAISPDGRWAATGGGSDNEIHLWDLRTGERRLGADGQPLTLGGQGKSVYAVSFSADGRQIGWGKRWESHTTLATNPLERALTLPLNGETLTSPIALDAAAATSFRGAALERSGWSLQHRNGGAYGHDAILDIKQGVQVVASIARDATNGYAHHAYSFTPDGETIISGGAGGVLTAYDRAGARLGEYVGHDGDVLAVACSPDGRFLLSGAADQTVRLWNLKTRELLVSLVEGDTGEWAMWTPQGYYAASGPGGEMVGWQINHGAGHEADYITAAQVRKSLNRPDIVSRAIALASAQAAVKEANGTNFKLGDLLAKPVPRLRIVPPAANAIGSDGTAEIEVVLAATYDPVKLIRVQVNGRQIAERLPAQGGGFQPGVQKFSVPLAKGANTVRIVASNQTGETSADVAITHAGDGQLDRRGTLYILAIGVDKYPNLPGHDLRYSGADARAFAAAMEKRAGALHERVVKRVLVNDAGAASDLPTAANVLNALGELQQARETDTVMVFVAGHAVNEGPNYRFLPTDSTRQASGTFLPASVVPWYAFQEAVEGAKGRRILFLDTCHAGNSYNQRLSNDSYQANIMVYSAARWDQEALERDDLGHGLFTYVTIEGIEGKAAKQGDTAGRITTLALRDFLAARVGEMARKLGHSQEPQYFRGRDTEDYVLAQRR